MRHSSSCLLPAVFAFGLAVPAFAQVHNTATVTVHSGPDKGTHIVQVPPEKRRSGGTCEIRKRADRQPGVTFYGSFYPDAGRRGPKTTPDGPMETSVEFSVPPGGTTDEVNLSVMFVVKTDLGLRSYEVESRRDPALKVKQAGRATATLSRSGSTATAKVDGETKDKVRITVEIDCRQVVEK